MQQKRLKTMLKKKLNIVESNMEEEMLFERELAKKRCMFELLQDFFSK